MPQSRTVTGAHQTKRPGPSSRGDTLEPLPFRPGESSPVRGRAPSPSRHPRAAAGGRRDRRLHRRRRRRARAARRRRTRPSRFAEAWAEQDFAAMHAELNPASRRQISLDDFDHRLSRTPRRRRRCASIDAGAACGPGRRRAARPSCRCRSAVETSRLRRDRGRARRCPTTTAASTGTRASSSPACARASSWSADPSSRPRAPILARDGTPLAEGPALAREHPLGSSAIDVTGEVGTAGDLRAG